MKITTHNYQPRFANDGGGIMTTSDAIRQLRRDLGNLSRVQLAGVLHCSPLTVRDWEQGQSAPSPELLSRIDAILTTINKDFASPAKEVRPNDWL
jgi:DNA-binding transcriptional regulator YiaG